MLTPAPQADCQSRKLEPLLTVQLGLRLGISSDDLRPIDKLPEVTIPKLFVVGAEDLHTTLGESSRFFAAAPMPKELWIVNGATHQDLYSFAPAEYEQRILSFFEGTLRPH